MIEEPDVDSEKPFVSESMKHVEKRKKRKKKGKHTGVKKHKPNHENQNQLKEEASARIKKENQLKEQISARLKSMIPQVEMESTEFNEVANVLKKKKKKKMKKLNGFVVTNINIEDKGLHTK